MSIFTLSDGSVQKYVLHLNRRTYGRTAVYVSGFPWRRPHYNADGLTDVTPCMQDRRFPSVDSSLGVVQTRASLAIDDRLLPGGLSHDAAASAPWLTRRSVSGPAAARISLAPAEKTSPSDDARCCSCRLCRSALRRLLVIV